MWPVGKHTQVSPSSLCLMGLPQRLPVSLQGQTAFPPSQPQEGRRERSPIGIKIQAALELPEPAFSPAPSPFQKTQTLTYWSHFGRSRATLSEYYKPCIRTRKTCTYSSKKDSSFTDCAHENGGNASLLSHLSWFSHSSKTDRSSTP